MISVQNVMAWRWQHDISSEFYAGRKWLNDTSTDCYEVEGVEEYHVKIYSVSAVSPSSPQAEKSAPYFPPLTIDDDELRIAMKPEIRAAASEY